MNKKTANALRTVVFTVLITLVCTSAISLVAGLTRERVARNQTLQLKRAVRQAAGLPFLAEPELSAWFAAKVRTPQTAANIFEVREAAGRLLILRQEGAGLWGTIQAMVGFQPAADSPRFAGFAVLAHSETPGLGARIEEPWFHRQFAGKTGPIEKLLPEKTGGRGDREMDAITGATITSQAVRGLLNQSRQKILEYRPEP